MCVYPKLYRLMVIVWGNRCLTINSSFSMVVFPLRSHKDKGCHRGHYAATPIQYAAKGLKRVGRWSDFGNQTMEAISCPHFMPETELAKGAHDFEPAVMLPGGGIRLTFSCKCWIHMDGTPILRGHGKKKSKQDAQSYGIICLTQLYVLIIGENQNDIGSDVSEVTVSLQTGPGAISRQVAKTFHFREASHQDKREEKKRKNGRVPSPCHHDKLLSSLQSFIHCPGSLQVPHAAWNKTQEGADKSKTFRFTHIHMDTQKPH